MLTELVFCKPSKFVSVLAQFPLELEKMVDTRFTRVGRHQEDEMVGLARPTMGTNTLPVGIAGCLVVAT